MKGGGGQKGAGLQLRKEITKDRGSAIGSGMIFKVGRGKASQLSFVLLEVASRLPPRELGGGGLISPTRFSSLCKTRV